ncbi:uncharacterized protein LOC143023965 [Oratosquilla oratoria]|uniref:uncharacterized protein LOC143023965 n=1 Tax=Oratosquilla oratoria TaxID=337810 RepID=UPI003F765875
MKLLWFLIPGCWMGNVIGHNTVTLQSSTELSRSHPRRKLDTVSSEYGQARAMAKKAEYCSDIQSEAELGRGNRRKVWQNLELLSLRKEMKLLWFLIPGCWMGNVIGHATVTLQSSTELSRRNSPQKEAGYSMMQEYSVNVLSIVKLEQWQRKQNIPEIFKVKQNLEEETEGVLRQVEKTTVALNVIPEYSPDQDLYTPGLNA